MSLVYLDNNATTQPAPQVVAAVREMLETQWGNPSSVHRFGQLARQRVELARAAVAKLLNCRDRDIVFTSGGTEANNLALRGSFDLARPGQRCVLVTSRIEHSAVREPAAALEKRGHAVAWLPLAAGGAITADALAQTLAQHAHGGDLAVVSVQWANNETGVLQPVAELAAAARTHATRTGATVVVHCDATQAVGKLPVDVRAAGVDLLTLAGHKFHAPKGAGALYVRAGTRLAPQTIGGPQERNRRGGTENVPAVVGLGMAADLAQAFVADSAERDRLATMRDQFEADICRAAPGAVVHGRGRPRLWNTSNIAFPRLEAEAILLGLSERGVCASAGAACSSGSLEPSPVLLAMGIPEILAHGSVRFSLSRHTTPDELTRAVSAIATVVERLRQTLPV